MGENKRTQSRSLPLSLLWRSAGGAIGHQPNSVTLQLTDAESAGKAGGLFPQQPHSEESHLLIPPVCFLYLRSSSRMSPASVLLFPQARPSVKTQMAPPRPADKEHDFLCQAA